MAATAVLLGWCAGDAAGYLGVVELPTPFGIAAAVGIAVLALLAWLSARSDAGPAAGRLSAVAPAVLLMVAAACLGGVVRGGAGRPPSGPGSLAAHIGQTVSIIGRVDSASMPSGGAAVNPAARVQAFHVVAAEVVAGGRAGSAAGAVLVQARGHAEVFDGQRVRINGRLARLRQLGPAGSTGYADRLEREGVVAEMSATSLQPLEAPPPINPARVVAGVRAELVTAMRDRLPEPEATIVLGEVAGIRGSVPADVDADLVQSGLVHILAISGIKVAIVAALLQAVTMPLLGRRGALVSIAGIAFYTLVGGATASALRSALMGSLGLVGAVLRRDTDLVRSLLLAAAAMLGQRPALVADLSFQYSFLGVLGIHLFAERISGRVRIVPQPFREALAVTCAAQLGTLPLTAHYFAVVPLVAPVANAVVLPTLPLAIVGGLAVAGLHAIGGLVPGAAWSRLVGAATVPVATLVFAVARLALVVAHLTRAVPGAALATPGFGVPATAAYYAATSVVAVAQTRRWPKLRLVALAGAVALAALLVAGRPDGRLHVEFLGGVTGPAAVVIAPDGATMLLGTGSSASALTPALDSALPPSAPVPGLPRRLDALVLTGSGREESGGLDALGSRRVATALTPDGMTGAAATSALARLRERGTQPTLLRPGDTAAWHGIELVAHPAGIPGELLLELKWGSVRLLVVSSADARNVPAIPAGDYAALGLGSAGVDPGLGGVSAGEVVVQNAGVAAVGGAASPAHPVARGVTQAAGDRLWESSRDGALRLSCDRNGCSHG